MDEPEAMFVEDEEAFMFSNVCDFKIPESVACVTYMKIDMHSVQG